MGKVIEAREFWNKFSENINKKLIDKWPSYDGGFDSLYKRSKEWTNEVITVIDETIKSIDNSLFVEHEYYRVDTIGYSKWPAWEPEKLPSGLNHYNWKLRIAVEHENAEMEWLDEAIKLSQLNCDLRVIIAYKHPDKDYNVLIRDCEKVVINCIGENEFVNQGWLIILGTCKGKHYSSPKYIPLFKNIGKAHFESLEE